LLIGTHEESIMELANLDKAVGSLLFQCTHYNHRDHGN